MLFETVSKIGDEDQHLLYCGDNLPIMQGLVEQYRGQVNLIYIDPPYNTGKQQGQYNDNYRNHEDWAAFMEPRLLLGWELLSEDGLIFISIGESEEAYLKVLCNRLFGEANKLAPIVWQCSYTVSNDTLGIRNQIEYILVYAKNMDRFTLNTDPLRPEYVKNTYKNPDNDPRGPWRGGVQLFKKKNKHSYTVTSPTGIEWTMPWNFSEEQWYENLVKNDLIYWGKNGDSCPVKKVFLKDTKGIGITNLWLGKNVGYTAVGAADLKEMFGDGHPFIYPKPVRLMKRILQVASRKDSLVMDFFAGSGTMGQAVLEFNQEDGGNRKFILITNNEDGTCDGTTFPRLKNVMDGYQGKSGDIHLPTGGSLTYYKLPEDLL